MPRLKRSLAIIAFWEDGRLVLEEYLQQKRIEASPDIVHLLSTFDVETGKDPYDILAESPDEFDEEELSEAVNNLVHSGFLVPEASADFERQVRLSFWHWPEPARSFFFATKNCCDSLEGPARGEYVASLSQASPQPPLYKLYPEKRQLALPKASKPPGEFADILLGRKSTREFADKPLTIEDLSSLLFYVWGEQGKLRSADFGELLHKTSPSGGARHPVEVYPLILRAEGISAGAYHYNVKDHAIEELRVGAMDKVLSEAVVGQDWIRRSSVIFLMTAIFDRVSWKYRHPRGLRVPFMDVGHLSQTLYLVCGSLSLGCCFVGAFKETPFESLIGIDGVNETLLSISAVGHPK